MEVMNLSPKLRQHSFCRLRNPARETVSCTNSLRWRKKNFRFSLLLNFCNLNSKLHCQAFQKSNGRIGSIPKLSCNRPSRKEQVFCVCFSDAFGDLEKSKSFAFASLTPLALGVWGFSARQLPLARRSGGHGKPSCFPCFSVKTERLNGSTSI